MPRNSQAGLAAWTAVPDVVVLAPMTGYRPAPAATPETITALPTWKDAPMDDADRWTPLGSAYDLDEAIVDFATALAREEIARTPAWWAATRARLETEELPDGRVLDFCDDGTAGAELRRRVAARLDAEA